MNSGTNDSVDVSTMARLKSCTFEEATTKVKDGSVFSKGVSETANEISSSCIKKLALQSAGLDNVASEEATSTLQNLMDSYSAVK